MTVFLLHAILMKLLTEAKSVEPSLTLPNMQLVGKLRIWIEFVLLLTLDNNAKE